jgi:hypothetical protein
MEDRSPLRKVKIIIMRSGKNSIVQKGLHAAISKLIPTTIFEYEYISLGIRSYHDFIYFIF